MSADHNDAADRREFPPFVRALPEADIPVDGLRGWMLQSRDGQVLFLEAQGEVLLPLHSHGDQWGFVVEGAMELNIGGRTVTFSRGDSYFIPEGTLHGGKLHPGFRVVDYFADPERYKPRGNSP